MAARSQGHVASVVHSGATLARCQGMVAEVVWSSRAPGRSEPRSFLLFQDAQLGGGRAAFNQKPEEEGAFLAVAYADLGNEGDLVPYVSGVWDTDPGVAQQTPAPLALRVQKTGSLWSSAEWAYQYEPDQPDQWRGMDDMRWVHDVHTPFGGSAVLGSCYAVCHSRAFNRIVAGYHPTGTTDLQWVYRSAGNADPKAWGPLQTLTLKPTRGPDLSAGYSTIWELPDGAMRWAYSYAPDTTVPNELDIDILGSTDGGQTWDLVKERVVTDLYGAPQVLRRFKVAASGDWMRMELWNDSVTNSGLVSATSTDRAATWQLVPGAEDGDGTDDTGANADANGKYETWDLCAVDSSGTFMRVRTRSTMAHLDFQLATRDGTWDTIDATLSATFAASDTDVVNVMCAGGAGRCFVLVFRSDHHGAATGLDYWSSASFIIPADRVERGWPSNEDPRVNRWAKWGGTDWLGYAGAARMHPKGCTLAWVGDRLALVGGAVDRQTGTSTAAWQTPAMHYIGGASRRPVRRPLPTHFDMTGSLVRYSWNAALGSIDPGGAATSAFMPWGRSGGGTPTRTWTPEAQTIQVDPTDTDGYAVSQALAGLLTTVADNGSICWSTRALPGTVPGTPYPTSWTQVGLGSPRWGMHVQSESVRSAGLTLDLGVHIDGNDGSFAVYDCAAQLTLFVSDPGALAGITSGDWYDFRVGMAHSHALEIPGAPQLFVDIGVGKAGDYTMVNTGLLTITGGAPLATAYELVEFGHQSTPVTSSSMQWREWLYSREDALAQVGFTNPGTLRGFDCIPHVQRVGAGHDVLWGGAGGFKGDLYDSPVRYEYGAGQMLGASPASQWHSTTSTTQTSVLDATLVRSDQNARFVHAGCAGISTNSRYLDLEYSDSQNIADPVYLRVDGLRYSVGVQATAAPTHVQVSGGPWQDGELTGHYLRAQPGAVANPGILRIAGNAGSWVHLTGLSLAGSLASYGITAGATLDVWGTQHLHAFDDWPEGVRVITAGGLVDGAFPRYVRVSIPGADVQGEPPEGYWQLGRLQAGLTLPVLVPLAWESVKDDEEGNIDLQTMASGVRVGYEAGAPRRTWSGTSKGDVSRWRVAFRSMVKALGRYSQEPVVVCTDDQQQNLRGLYSRFMGGTDMANAGWQWNGDRSRWERMGDLKVTFEQEV